MINDVINKTKNIANQTKNEKREKALIRESIIMEHLFDRGAAANDPDFRKALIIRMLATRSDKLTFTQNHVGRIRPHDEQSIPDARPDVAETATTNTSFDNRFPHTAGTRS